MNERYHFAQTIIKEAGSLAHSYFKDYTSLTLEEKSNPQDLVSEADVHVEKVLKEQISSKFPEDGFYGEEGGIQDGNGSYWLIDPIDGTANFVRGLAYYCVSIGFIQDDSFGFGVIYDPVLEELYHAKIGGGAFLNGNKIQVENPTWDKAVLCLGRTDRHALSKYTSLIPPLLSSGAEYRRLGAGALALAQVAGAKLSGYYEPHMNPWDAIAGLIIAKEAGAVVKEYMHNWRKGGEIYAVSPSIDRQMREILGQV